MNYSKDPEGSAYGIVDVLYRYFSGKTEKNHGKTLKVAGVQPNASRPRPVSDLLLWQPSGVGPSSYIG
jgi:hypothetical protein